MIKRLSLVVTIILFTFFTTIILKTDILNLIISIVLLTVLAPPNWTVLRKVIFAPLIFFLFGILLCWILFFFKIPFLPLYLSLLSNTLSLLWWLKSSGKIIPKVWFDKNDLLALFVAVAVASLFIFSIAKYNAGFDSDPATSFRLPLLGKSIDIVNHFAIFQSVVKSQGYSYSAQNSIWLENNYPSTNYMQGSHLVPAILFWYFGNQFFSSDYLTSLTTVFSCCVLMFYAYFAYFFMRIFTNCSAIWRRKHVFPIMVTLLLAIIVFIFGSCFFALTLLGFYAQIAALLILCAIVDLLTDQETPSQTALLWSSLLNISVACSWFFLSPIALFITFYALVQNKANKKQWFIFISAVLSIVLQVAYTFSLQKTAINQIAAAANTDGIMVKFSSTVLGALLVFSSIYCYKNLKERSSRLVVLTVFALSSLGFSAVLYGYQMYTSGQATYYFYKSVYTIALPLLLLSLLHLEILLEKLYTWINEVIKQKGKRGAALITASSTVVIVLLFFFIIAFASKSFNSSEQITQLAVLLFTLFLLAVASLFVTCRLFKATHSGATFSVLLCITLLQCVVIAKMDILEVSPATGDVRSILVTIAQGEDSYYSAGKFNRLQNLQTVYEKNPSAIIFPLGDQFEHILMQAYYLDARIETFYSALGWTIGSKIEDEDLKERMVSYINTHPEQQFILYNLEGEENVPIDDAFIKLELDGKLQIL
ncbi:MAG: hypothetical protein WCP97_06620 [bacterium]